MSFSTATTLAGIGALAAFLYLSITICRNAAKALPGPTRAHSTTSNITLLMLACLAVYGLSSLMAFVPHLQLLARGSLALVMVSTFVVAMKAYTRHRKEFDAMKANNRPGATSQTIESAQACQFLSNATLAWGSTSLVLMIMAGSRL